MKPDDQQAQAAAAPAPAAAEVRPNTETVV